MAWHNSPSKWIFLIDYRMFVVLLYYLRHSISLNRSLLEWRHPCTNSSGTSNRTKHCYFSFWNNRDELSPVEPHPRIKEEVFNTLKVMVGVPPPHPKGGQDILIWSRTQYVHIVRGIIHSSCIISFIYTSQSSCGEDNSIPIHMLEKRVLKTLSSHNCSHNSWLMQTVFKPWSSWSPSSCPPVYAVHYSMRNVSFN